MILAGQNWVFGVFGLCRQRRSLLRPRDRVDGDGVAIGILEDEGLAERGVARPGIGFPGEHLQGIGRSFLTAPQKDLRDPPLHVEPLPSLRV